VGGHIHFNKSFAQQEQDDGDREARGQGDQDQKDTRGQMCEHHCVQQAESLREPCRADVRNGIQDVHTEEEKPQFLLNNTELTKEPVRDQRISEQSAAKAVERAQNSERVQEVQYGSMLEVRKVSTVFAAGRMFQPAPLWNFVGFRP
jgi:hypothetical protein